MSKAIHLLIIFALTFGGFACARQADDTVEAGAGETMERATEDVRTPARPADETPARTPAAPPRRAPESRPAAPARDVEPAAPPAARRTVAIPSGTAFTVTLQDAIATDTASVGDPFTANLAEPIIVNGQVLAEKGDAVRGRVKNVDEPGKVKGRARLELELTEIMTDARTSDISTEPFVVVASDNKERDAAIIAGGAGVGAVVGAVAGGKKGAALGAIIGGGTGTTAVLVTRGDQIRLEPETRINFILADSVSMPVIRRSNAN